MEVQLLLLALGVLLLGGGCRAAPSPPSCGSPEAVRVAEESVHLVNLDRSSGYVWSLNRLYDVQVSPEQNKSTLYKFILDVLETKCHIISKKPWKQCEVRNVGEIPTYGECEVTAHFDSQVKLRSYSCALHQVPATKVVDECPDCPTADNLNDPIVVETARLALQKFNQKSLLANYFSLENVTQASSQWVVGPAYFVDFTIVETVCSKNTDLSELGNCPPMGCQFAHKGFCSGQHVTVEDEDEVRNPVGPKPLLPQSSVTVNCEIYEPQAAKVEEAAHAAAGEGHGDHQPHNHTHLHPHEHAHAHTQGADSGPSPRPVGTVVKKPAGPRSAPSASNCPGPLRHADVVGITG